MSPASKEIFITKQDHDKLLELLREVPRESAARKELEMLNTELGRATIVEPQDIPSDVVTMNSSIDVEDTATGETMSFSLVYPADLNLAERKISIFSPVGTAVIGYGIGDIIEWPVPSGTKKLKITAIHYQPEAAGDYHL